MINDYSRFPSEIKRALEVLEDESIFKILKFIYDKAEISFSELTEKLDLSQSSVNSALRKLMFTSLIDENHAKGKILYRLSSFGEDLIKALKQ